jgi:hypothetical protein
MTASKSAARNVISFPASASKRPPRSKAKGKRAAAAGRGAAPPPDQLLIRNCVDFARAVAAFHAGFDADPDGNNETAGGPSGRRISEMASKLLAEITRTRATTAKGLQAKARIVPMILDGSDIPDDNEIEYFEAFAFEVKEFLEPLIDASNEAVRS